MTRRIDWHSDSDAVVQYGWSRHANPRSVWVFVLAYPTLVVAVYRRQWSLLGGVLLFALLNQFIATPPTDDGAWTTRVVLGELVWLDRGLGSSPRDALFVVATAPVYVFTLRAAAKRRAFRTAAGMVVSMALMFVFFDRMVRLYETSNQS